MRKITNNTVEESILNELIPQKINKRESLINQINEIYQYHPTYFKSINKGDYTVIKMLLEKYGSVENVSSKED